MIHSVKNPCTLIHPLLCGVKLNFSLVLVFKLKQNNIQYVLYSLQNFMKIWDSLPSFYYYWRLKLTHYNKNYDLFSCKTLWRNVMLALNIPPWWKVTRSLSFRGKNPKQNNTSCLILSDKKMMTRIKEIGV